MTSRPMSAGEMRHNESLLSVMELNLYSILSHKASKICKYIPEIIRKPLIAYVLKSCLIHMNKMSLT